MSPSHFGRSFKATVGVTPHSYLLNERVAMAKRLIAAGRLSIADIALECGFVSQAHFTTVFRKLSGSTPKTYSRSLLKHSPAGVVTSAITKKLGQNLKDSERGGDLD
jgi:AraC-like DNA-binding protein